MSFLNICELSPELITDRNLSCPAKCTGTSCPNFPGDDDLPRFLHFDLNVSVLKKNEQNLSLTTKVSKKTLHASFDRASSKI